MKKTTNKSDSPGFTTLVEQLTEHGGSEAENLAKKIRDAQKRALYLVGGEAEAEEKKAEEEKRRLIVGLAFNEGDMEKGYRDTIALSKSDLNHMSEMGINIGYSSDVLYGIPINKKSIPFIMPNGQSGELLVYVDVEKGKFTYNFRKNISRADDNRKSAVVEIA